MVEQAVQDQAVLRLAGFLRHVQMDLEPTL
jgi:hypothetical protein